VIKAPSKAFLEEQQEKIEGETRENSLARRYLDLCRVEEEATQATSSLKFTTSACGSPNQQNPWVVEPTIMMAGLT